MARPMIDDLAAGAFGGERDGFQARDVRGERRHGDALRRLGDEALQHDGDLRLAGADAVAHRVGGIGDQRQHAFGAKRRQAVLVGGEAEARGRIELPVAGMEDQCRRACGWPARSARGSSATPGCIRPRTGRPARARPGGRCSPGSLGAFELAGALGLQQRRREGRHVDRRFELRPESEERRRNGPRGRG